MSSSPMPLMEDRKPYQSRKLSKPSKPVNRSSKRSNSSCAQSSVVIDRRHKRIWKACEGCRVKKTKCDKELPCKRCKDNGLVCTARSRKKKQFKQLSRGYAELLENTQYTLTATVQELYTMVRNGKTWDLGEPEMNDRGQPVIHDLASKLGCIRPSLDLPDNFLEGAEDFAELPSTLQAAQSEVDFGDIESQKYARDFSFSPAFDSTDRVSSTESDHSDLSKEHSQTWFQQRQAAELPPHTIKPAPLSSLLEASFDEEAYQPCASLNTSHSTPSSIDTNLQIKSPMFKNTSPFFPWSVQDNCLSSVHPLDLTAQYMRAQQMQCIPPQGKQIWEADLVKAMQLNNYLNLADGTIQPTMGGDYDGQTGMDLVDLM